MALLPDDIQQVINRDFSVSADREYVVEKLATLWATNLNVGADQLAKSILYLAAGKVELVDNMFATNFYGDPRDLLVEAMEKASEISTETSPDELRQHKLLYRLLPLLRRWKGKQMELRDLTVSPRSVCIRLSDNRHLNAPPYLQIRCQEPTYMKGQFDYDSSDLEIKQLGKQLWKRYVVYDSQSGFELGCQDIEVSEHLE